MHADTVLATCVVMRGVGDEADFKVPGGICWKSESVPTRT
jgi:hypothetical protein